MFVIAVEIGRESIDEKGMERREEQREEGDSERVEVREGGECVGSRGRLKVESDLRVFCNLGFFLIVWS